MNILSDTKKEAIWIPRFSFLNLNSICEETSNEDNIVLVKPDNDYEYFNSDSTNLYNNRVFYGSKNPFVMFTTYSPKLFCNFAENMILFPFDTQFCSIDIVPKENFELFSEIKLENSSYNGSDTFSGFYFKHIENCMAMIDKKPVYR